MLGVSIPKGAVFHVKTKRRREVAFTPALRDKTVRAANRLHELIAAEITPPPVVKPQCQGCSLVELCLPKVLSRDEAIGHYMRALWTLPLESESSEE